MSVFQEIGVVPELIRAVEDLGWLLPTPIQQEAVPLILGGGDVMAAAETGSGKTGAFALPILQLVQESLRAAEAAKQLPDQHAERANGAEVGDCVLSSDDRDAMMAISPDGLTCQSRAEKKWQGCRATVGVVGGKVYWEAVVKDEGLCRVGWASQAATLELGTDAHGFGYGGTAKKSWKRQFEEYGEAYGLDDTIGCMLDCEEGSIAFSRNGRHLGPAFSLPASFKSAALFPAVCVKNAELQVNFGAAPFRRNPPAGFVGLAKAEAGHSVSAMDRAAAPAGSGTEGPQARKPSCIVLEPARDLAEQTHKCIGEFKRFMASPAITHLLLVGGLDSGRQAAALRRGVDIITGTPGRVMDLVESGKLAMDQVRFFVLDEADRLLDTGNLDVIMKMYNRLQKSGCGSDRLQVLMFSATLHSPEVRQLARQICQNPILIDLKGKEYVPETVDHVRVPIDPEADRSWLQSEPALSTDNCHVFDNVSAAAGTAESLSEAVKRLKPRVLLRLVQLYRMEQCLIFCRTNFDCNLLEQFLIRAGGGAVHRGRRDSGKENPFSCRVLAGQRSMDERREALQVRGDWEKGAQAFKDGDIRFLICTDVAARGIDIKNLPYVVNMTLPDKSEDYVHRIGRVGRADTIGLALSLVSTVPEKVWYCSVKDYKPWLQPKKGDVRTRECGGHTIWYNEPQLLKDIENRLGKSIPPVNSDLSLPREVAEKLSKEAAKYGEQRGGGVSAEVAEHLVRIQGQVAELSKLEWTAQASFFHMQMRWAA